MLRRTEQPTVIRMKGAKRGAAQVAWGERERGMEEPHTNLRR